jgi:hypothetical protein
MKPSFIKKKKVYNFIFSLILLFGCFFVANSASAISGTYTSSSHNMGGASILTNVDWIKVGGGTVAVSLRTGNLDPPTDGSWTSVSDNSDPAVSLDGNQYVQYQVTFDNVYSTTNNDINVAITSFMISYSSASASSPQILTSSIYNTTSWDSKIASVSWDELSLPSGSIARLYLETASTDTGLSGGAAFQEITGCTKSGQTRTCTNVPAAFQSGNDDKYFHYRIDLHSGAGGFPEVGNIKISYNANFETPSLDRIDVTTAMSYLSTGSFESEVYDTIANQQFNAMTIVENLSGGSIITKVRSCNQLDCSDGTAWGSCSSISSGDITGGCVTDSERYIQYRLELGRGGDIGSTPITNSIRIDFDQLQVYAPGTSFIVIADIFDPDTGIANPPAPVVKILNSSAVQVGPDYTLYDDGSHGDDISPIDSPLGANQPDGRFGTNSITIFTEDIYTIQLVAQNGAGIVADINPVGSFVIFSP